MSLPCCGVAGPARVTAPRLGRRAKYPLMVLLLFRLLQCQLAAISQDRLLPAGGDDFRRLDLHVAFDFLFVVVWKGFRRVALSWGRVAWRGTPRVRLDVLARVVLGFLNGYPPARVAFLILCGQGSSSSSSCRHCLFSPILSRLILPFLCGERFLLFALALNRVGNLHHRGQVLRRRLLLSRQRHGRRGRRGRSCRGRKRWRQRRHRRRQPLLVMVVMVITIRRTCRAGGRPRAPRQLWEHQGGPARHGHDLVQLKPVVARGAGHVAELGGY
mmetsp:Transcript_8687/g.18700  ORF Transcript_8687/g.18700 Transcript_8687/m.18700 type:complete len:272 (+) Transcript_8687:446-1261(+)